jgi:hypothetical protein
MKKILFISILLITNLCLQSQDTKVQFDELAHDFGTIPDTEQVTHDFTVTNTSTETLLITGVTASCGCTTPVWTKTPIEPGKTGTVTAIYNPKGRSLGAFNKSLYVKTNLANAITLKIKGKVVASGRVKNIPQPEKQYPYSFGKLLSKLNQVDFGKLKPNGSKKTVSINVYNDYDQNIELKTIKKPKQISVNFDKTEMEAKTSGTIDISFEGDGLLPYGIQDDVVELSVAGAVYKLPVSVTILDFPDDKTYVPKDKAAKININYSEINFGNFSSGSSRTIKVSNSGKGILYIRNIQTFDPSVSVSTKNFELNPDEIGDFKVSVDKNKLKSPLASKILIICNDPTNQTIEIQLSSAQTK